MKKIFFISLFLGFASSAWAAGFQSVPRDLSVRYEFVQGGPVNAATFEKYTVKENTLIHDIDYIPTQYGSDSSKRVKENKTYPLSPEQLQELWSIISQHQFLSWPLSNPDRPPLSGNQTFIIQANGKTLTHTMWDSGQKESFIEFSADFIAWAKKVIRLRF